MIAGENVVRGEKHEPMIMFEQALNLRGNYGALLNGAPVRHEGAVHGEQR